MSGLKCLIPTPAPFVQLSHEWLWASPSPPPQPGHLQSLTPHCCAPLRAREMGPPQGPKGQSWVSPKHPAVLGHRGTVWGSRCAPHASSASALHPGATPPPWCLSAQRGTMVCTFISPPRGAQPGRCITAGPPEGVESSRSRITRSRVLVGGGFQHLWNPCGCVGDLPSAKRFPLSRSKNTKLGIPGAPLPGLPNPIPALPPGWPS